MISFKEHNESAGVNLEYHINNSIQLNENVFRLGSKAYYDLFNEARKRMKEGTYTPEGVDKFLLEETEIGTYGVYDGAIVPIDCPLMEAEYKGKKVQLNKPKRGGSKKFYVYVKSKKGNVKKVSFGDTGLSVKFKKKGARASFAARHKCATKKDKTKAGYWSCNIGRYWKSLGGSSNFSGYW